MRHRIPRRTGWILGSAAVVLLAGPSILLWQALAVRNRGTRNICEFVFKPCVYERAGLVFTYRLENRTRRSAHLTSDNTTIRVKQPADQAAAGYPVIQPAAGDRRAIFARRGGPLGTAVTAYGCRRGADRSRTGASPARSARPGVSAGGAADDAHRRRRRQARPPPVPDVDARVEQSLWLLEGFELVNQKTGLRITFPRGW